MRGRARDERRRQWNTKKRLHRERRTQSRVGPLPSPFIAAHSVEDRIPHMSLYVGTKVFVKASSRPTVVAADFKGLPDFEITL